MGRPSHQPDPVLRRQVEAMCAFGVPETDIGRSLGIDAKTLRKHYRVELDLGHVRANSKVAEALYRKATSDGPQSVTAAIFWLKARAGWKETTQHEIGGARDIAPITRIERIIVDPQGNQRRLSTGPVLDLEPLPDPEGR